MFWTIGEQYYIGYYPIRSYRKTVIELCIAPFCFKKIVTRKIDSENQKADIFTKGLQGHIFARVWILLCGW